MTDVVLTPAACYSVYPVARRPNAARRPGMLFDVLGVCFRQEPSDDPARMRMFRQREYVYVGEAEQCRAHRDRGSSARVRRCCTSLQLPVDRGRGQRPVLRSRRPHARGEPARAGAQVRARRADHVGRSADGVRVVQLSPGHVRSRVRDSERARIASRTRRAWASASSGSRSRCSSITGSSWTRGPCAFATHSECDMSATAMLPGTAGTYVPHLLHGEERDLAGDELLRRSLDRGAACARAGATRLSGVHVRPRLRGRSVHVLQVSAARSARALRHRRAGAQHLAAADGARRGAVRARAGC